MNSKIFTVLATACVAATFTYGQVGDAPAAPATPNPGIGGPAGMSIENMRAAIQMRFERLDRDGDGYVSKKEFPGPRGAAQDRPREQRRAGNQGARRQGPMQAAWGSFKDLDTDEDGQLSEAEMRAPIQGLAELDVNGDGMLDRNEMRGMRPGRNARQGAGKAEE